MGQLDSAIDETIRNLLDRPSADGLRAGVLARLTERDAGVGGISHSRVWRVGAATLAIGAVAIVGRLMLTPPADMPPADDAPPEAAQGGAPTLPDILSSGQQRAGQGRSVAVAMPPGGDAQDAVTSARSAAPEAIAAGARVMNWDGTVLSQGGNLWTCLPDRFDTPETDPWCLVDTSLIALWPQAIRIGGNIPPPERVINVPPVYPPAAQDAGQIGIVVLEAMIGPNGRVGGVRMLLSSGYEMLDQSAFEGVLYWSYDSTVLNGQPVPVIMTVTMNYTLSE